jgi:hypothetical protein
MTTNGTQDVCAVVDAHVHLHACYDPDAFFDHACFNLASAAAHIASSMTPAYFLLMTECESDNYFTRLHKIALGRATGYADWLKRWTLRMTDEIESVVAEDENHRLYVIAGRQVQCREGLEVLVLGTRHRFKDGGSIRDVLNTAASLRLPHVIPWGLGKWFFKRGKLVSELMREYRKPTLFLGDEGGRPGFWPYPAHFREGATLGVRDLPGTDPLPFPHDVVKVGKVGIRVPIQLDEQYPARSLLNVLSDGHTPFERFAHLEPPLMFVRNQVAMQMRKRRPQLSAHS